jgi:predicted ABC-type transport system involved in lysophospholipase L1 biosynthesis ATPase subunit
MAETILTLTDVAKRYDSVGSREGLYVLKDINLAVAAGEALAVVGPSGSGKSTLLNIIGALDRPTSGAVTLEGRDLVSLADDELAAIRAARIGLVFQLHHLLPQCSALENVLVPTLALKNRPPARQVQDRARDLLARVGLGERMDHRPGQLSGGECQRVAVVRALINRPRLLLADEPTGSLDRAAAEALADLLVGLNRQEGVTLIVVTHSSDVAARMGRVMELRDGVLK